MENKIKNLMFLGFMLFLPKAMASTPILTDAFYTCTMSSETATDTVEGKINKITTAKTTRLSLFGDYAKTILVSSSDEEEDNNGITFVAIGKIEVPSNAQKGFSKSPTFQASDAKFEVSLDLDHGHLEIDFISGSGTHKLEASGVCHPVEFQESVGSHN